MRLFLASLMLLSAAACASAPAPSPFPPEAFGYGYTRAEAPHDVVVLRLVAADDATRAATGDLVLTRYIATTPSEETDAADWLSLRRADGTVLHFQASNHVAPHVTMQGAGSPLARALGLTGEARPELFAPIERERVSGGDLCGGAYGLLGMAMHADGRVTLAPFTWGESPGIDPTMDFDLSRWPDSMVRPCAMLNYRRR